MLVIFRLAAHIPVPGIDAENLGKFLAGNQILGLLNLFSGGTMENFSIVMLGVAPYYFFHYLSTCQWLFPVWKNCQKRRSWPAKINMYTRLATVPLAILQAYGMIQLLNKSQYQILPDLSVFRLVAMILTVTAGTVFLMWIGELITERKIGNGVSLLIFAGIMAALPQAVQKAAVNYTPADLYTYVLFIVIAVGTVIGVVVISEGQRNVPVSYAKQIRGNRVYGGANTHLPLRVNMAGVIPIIFAISIILFPSMIAQFLSTALVCQRQSRARWSVFSIIRRFTRLCILCWYSASLTFTPP